MDRQIDGYFTFLFGLDFFLDFLSQLGICGLSFA